MKKKQSAKMLSKNDLLKWVNDTLSTPLTKIQQLGTGTTYCALVNYFHPNTIPQTLISRNAKTEYDYINNFKLLQTGLQKLRLTRTINIDRLVKMRYQENWELVSWFHKQFTRSDKEEIAQDQPRFSTPTIFDSIHKKRNFVEFSTQHLNKQNSTANSGIKKFPPINGKSSVSQEVFQNNHMAMIDRIKEILIKSEPDSEKVKQLKMLLNIKPKQISFLEKDLLLNDEKDLSQTVDDVFLLNS